MSYERVIKALVSLGLSKMDAEVYVYLAKKGPLQSSEIAQELKMHNKQVNHSLEDLQNKHIIEVNKKQQDKFDAIPFEEALNLLIEINKDQAEALSETRKELLSSWKKMTKKPINNN